MRLEYELLEDDYINFNLLHMKHSKTIKKSMKINRYLTPVIFLLLPIMLYIIHPEMESTQKNFWFVIFLFAFILWVCFYDKWTYKINEKRLRSVIKEKDNEGFFGTHTLEIENDTIKISDETGEKIISILSLKDIIEDEKYIILYLNSLSAIIVPKRVFKNQDEKVKFRSLVKV